MTPATRLRVVLSVALAAAAPGPGAAEPLRVDPLLTLDVAEVVADAERDRAAIGESASSPGGC